MKHRLGNSVIPINGYQLLQSVRINEKASDEKPHSYYILDEANQLLKARIKTKLTSGEEMKLIT